MTNSIDLKNLPKAEVLAALYNAAAPCGLGFLQAAATPSEMTVADAREILARQQTFEYLNGRSFKVTLDTDTFDPWLYDRDNGGPGTAEKVIEQLRSTGAVSSVASTNNCNDMTDQHLHGYPIVAEAYEIIGQAVETLNRLWSEVTANGVPVASQGLTPRQYLDWATAEAMKLYSDPDKSVLLFIYLVNLNNSLAWICTHPTTPMLLQMGKMGGRDEMRRMMSGFAA